MSVRFFPQNLKKTKEFLFWTTLFSSKCSFGLIDQSFVIPADFVCGKSKLFSLYIRNSFEEHFFVRKILILSKRSSALKEGHFDISFKKSLLKEGNWQSRSSNIRKCDEKKFPGLLKCTLENAANFFQATSQCLSLKTWKRRKNFLSQQHCLPQNVPSS